MESEKLGKGITIVNKGTSNPALLYNGKPMMRMGSVRETGLFAFPWDSSEAVLADKTHSQWAEWQKMNGMGYARAYPESGFTWWEKEGRSEKIIPWKVDHWVYDYDSDGEPVVDLTQFDDKYWNEFENTLRKCKENNIVVIIQLYQACYFGVLSGDKTGHNRTWWETSFFHPNNNINHWPVGEIWGNSGIQCGNDFMQRCVDDYHGDRNTWWKMHSDYVRRILDSIGDKGNVIIDLGNELGYRDEGFHCYEWVERTIDVIEEWESQHDVDILIGMDEHFWFRVPGKFDWVRAHPRLELLIMHGAMDVMHEEDWNFNKGYTPRDPGKLRVQYKKPSVTIHNQHHSIESEDRDAAFQRSYHWLGMMQKVQALASYGYGKFVQDETEREKFESDTMFLMDLYDSLKDYTSLIMNDESSGKITGAPGYDKYKYLLSSDKEALFYTHTEGYGVTVPEGQVLKLNSLDLPDGRVRMKIIRPHDQSMEARIGKISNRSIDIVLPSFFEDIAVYIEPGE
ncbi:hypothetical protein ACFL6S_19535 [Candidatus Poribacteria bacterium]